MGQSVMSGGEEKREKLISRDVDESNCYSPAVSPNCTAGTSYTGTQCLYTDCILVKSVMNYVELLLSLLYPVVPLLLICMHQSINKYTLHIRSLCITHSHHTQTHIYSHFITGYSTYSNICVLPLARLPNFHKKEELDSAIREFVTQMGQVQPAAKDANIQSKQEEEREELIVSRFETAAERQEKQKKEVDLANLER